MCWGKQKQTKKQNKTKPGLSSSETRFFVQMKPRFTCTRMTGKENCGEVKGILMEQSTPQHLSNMVEAVFGQDVYGCQLNSVAGVC